MAKLDFSRIRRMMTGTDTRDRYVIGNNTVAHLVRNDSTFDNLNFIRITLHDSPVAWAHFHSDTGTVHSVSVTLAGYPKVTTRDRINSVLREFVPRARCWQAEGRQFLDTGHEVIPWDKFQIVTITV